MKKRAIKKGRKIQFNLSNRFLYTFIAAVIIISLGIVVYALAPGQTPNPGHNISQLGAPSTCSPTQVLQWSGSAWQCADLPGASSGGTFESITLLYKDSRGNVTTQSSGNTLIGYAGIPGPRRFMAGRDYDNDGNGDGTIENNPPDCWTFAYPIGSITDEYFNRYKCVKTWDAAGLTEGGGPFDGTAEAGNNPCTNSWNELIENGNYNPYGATPAGTYTIIRTEKVGTITSGCSGSNGGNPDADPTAYTYIVEYKLN